MFALLKASLIIGLVALNAFFVATEYALLSVRRTRLEQLGNEGVSQAKLVLSLLSDMVALFSGTQLGSHGHQLIDGLAGREPSWPTPLSIRWTAYLGTLGARRRRTLHLRRHRFSADYDAADGAG